MNEIRLLETRTKDTIKRLLSIWEDSVRATHTFLTEEDIQQIKPDVEMALSTIAHLYCFYDRDQVIGFIGIEEEKIEMLFIDASVRGKGTGRKLIEFALEHLNAKYVDVNEQNSQGVGFYYHMGFEMISRSKLDDQRRPFPILHLGQRG